MATSARATDGVGNPDPTPAERSFTVDTTPPGGGNPSDGGNPPDGSDPDIASVARGATDWP